MIKMIDGHLVEFVVVLQIHPIYPKVISVRLAQDGGRPGVATSMSESLEYARKIARMQTEWDKEYKKHVV